MNWIPLSPFLNRAHTLKEKSSDTVSNHKLLICPFKSHIWLRSSSASANHLPSRFIQMYPAHFVNFQICNAPSYTVRRPTNIPHLLWENNMVQSCCISFHQLIIAPYHVSRLFNFCNCTTDFILVTLARAINNNNEFTKPNVASPFFI